MPTRRDEQRPLAPLRAWVESTSREMAAEAWARASGDSHAASANAVATRWARRFDGRLRDRVLAAIDEIADFETLPALLAHLRRLLEAPGYTRARARFDAAGETPIAHDSDLHRPADLLARLAATDDDRRRQTYASALERAATTLADAQAAGREDVEHAHEETAWLAAHALSPDASPEDATSRAGLEALFAETEEVQREALERAAHHAGRSPPERMLDLFALGLAPTLRAPFPARSRWRRLGASLEGIGLLEPLRKSVRVGSPHEASLALTPRVIMLDPPRDVRIAPAPLEAGLASELFAAEALGRALAAGLGRPDLPPELRRPIEGTFGRALGLLIASLHTDRRFLARTRGLDGRQAEGLAAAALAFMLSDLRIELAAALARHEGVSPGPHLEQAIGAHVAPSIARVVGGRAHPTPDARLRAWLALPRLAGCLRERFDEDFWLNPRVAEVIRSAAAQGGGLSIEDFLALMDAQAFDPIEWRERLG